LLFQNHCFHYHSTFAHYFLYQCVAHKHPSNGLVLQIRCKSCFSCSLDITCH
jgi:hypothetical protein